MGEEKKACPVCLLSGVCYYYPSDKREVLGWAVVALVEVVFLPVVILFLGVWHFHFPLISKISNEPSANEADHLRVVRMSPEEGDA